MYKIAYTEEAKKNIQKLTIKKRRQIKEAVERIAEAPSIGKRLTHELSGLFSYRSGDYRIIYQVYHKEILVIILTIGHRKEIYKITSRRKFK